MQIPQLVRYLDDPQSSRPWLESWGLIDARRAHANLVALAQTGVTLDLLADLCDQLAAGLPKLSDPDMALNNFDRFVAASRNPLSLASLLERDREALPILLQIFSTSQYLSDLLVADAESYDLLRMTQGEPVAREVLVQELLAEVLALSDEQAVMMALRRFKRRETLRIAYGDIVRGQHIAVVTQQISYLADAICTAAVASARKKLIEQRGEPLRPDKKPARFVALALGKLGGCELNYSSDIDLMFLYDAEGQTAGPRSTSNQEFFDRLGRAVLKLLTEPTALGSSYRVDLRLRPEGANGPIVMSAEQAMNYYDLLGRTWERQALVKARPVAGSLELGSEFLAHLESWIYRRYLARADITGIKALKRRIEHRAIREAADTTNVKTGHGGIRDIEFVIQFLQLLNGGDLKEIRTANTLDAIARLESAGCLTMQERGILEENYAFLRKLEHRLQIMFDLQTHALPAEESELRKVAIRMGYSGDALKSFQHEYRTKTELNRKILDHLLHDAFSDDPATRPESDLVLDPDPPEKTIVDVLGRYKFLNVMQAYRNLMALSTEKIKYLSTRRCRHFLAAIAPRLLAEVAGTPNPDFTLNTLAKVSESLGGKGVLWELFSFNPPSMNLYVRLCAGSQYLAGILTSHPGMIDELLDSLLLDKLPSLDSLRNTLGELCRGAQDIDPILHSFKNSQHLAVGVRDILGKDDVYDTHRSLSDIAEVCLEEIARREYARLVEKYGIPIVQEPPPLELEDSRALVPDIWSQTQAWEDGLPPAALPVAGQPCEFVIMAMGKLGGREPNYHSDLDLVFLYDADGYTRHIGRAGRRETTSNQHFFSQLGQRIIKIVSQLGPQGRLFEIDSRLRPTGKNGSLAVSVDELYRYFYLQRGQLWERQALCKARPILGSTAARRRAMHAVRKILREPAWQPQLADEIRQMRKRLEDTASPRNLKRGLGGTVDIEFAVQMLQLAHAGRTPDVLTPNTLDAIDALRAAGALAEGDREYLARSYRFLRSVEARLRLMNTTARHDLPEDASDLNKLAYLLGYPSGGRLEGECLRYTEENRRRYDRLFDLAAASDDLAMRAS